VGYDIPGAEDLPNNRMVTLGQIPVNNHWNQAHIEQVWNFVPAVTKALGLAEDAGVIRNDMVGVLTGVSAIIQKAMPEFWSETNGNFRFDWMGNGHGHQYALSGKPAPFPTEGGHLFVDFGRDRDNVYDTESRTSIPALIAFAIENGFPAEPLQGNEVKPLGDAAADNGHLHHEIAIKTFEEFGRYYAQNLAIGYLLTQMTGVGNGERVLLGGGITRGQTGAIIRDLTVRELGKLGLADKISIQVLTEPEIKAVLPEFNMSSVDDIGAFGSAVLIQNLFAERSKKSEARVLGTAEYRASADDHRGVGRSSTKQVTSPLVLSEARNEYPLETGKPITIRQSVEGGKTYETQIVLEESDDTNAKLKVTSTGGDNFWFGLETTLRTSKGDWLQGDRLNYRWFQRGIGIQHEGPFFLQKGASVYFFSLDFQEAKVPTHQRIAQALTVQLKETGEGQIILKISPVTTNEDVQLEITSASSEARDGAEENIRLIEERSKALFQEALDAAKRFGVKPNWLNHAESIPAVLAYVEKHVKASVSSTKIALKQLTGFDDENHLKGKKHREIFKLQLELQKEVKNKIERMSTRLKSNLLKVENGEIRKMIQEVKKVFDQKSQGLAEAFDALRSEARVVPPSTVGDFKIEGELKSGPVQRVETKITELSTGNVATVTYPVTGVDEWTSGQAEIVRLAGQTNDLDDLMGRFSGGFNVAKGKKLSASQISVIRSEARTRPSLTDVDLRTIESDSPMPSAVVQRFYPNLGEPLSLYRRIFQEWYNNGIFDDLFDKETPADPDAKDQQAITQQQAGHFPEAFATRVSQAIHRIKLGFKNGEDLGQITDEVIHILDYALRNINQALSSDDIPEELTSDSFTALYRSTMLLSSDTKALVDILWRQYQKSEARVETKLFIPAKDEGITVSQLLEKHQAILRKTGVSLRPTLKGLSFEARLLNEAPDVVSTFSGGLSGSVQLRGNQYVIVRRRSEARDLVLPTRSVQVPELTATAEARIVNELVDGPVGTSVVQHRNRLAPDWIRQVHGEPVFNAVVHRLTIHLRPAVDTPTAYELAPGLDAFIAENMPIFSRLINTTLTNEASSRIFDDAQYDIDDTVSVDFSADGNIQPIDVIATLIVLARQPHLEYTLIIDGDVQAAKDFLAQLNQLAAEYELGFKPTQLENFRVKVVNGVKDLAAFVGRSLSDNQAPTAVVTGRKQVDKRFNAMPNFARVLVKDIANHSSTIVIVAAMIDQLTKNSLDRYDDERLLTADYGVQIMQEIALLQAYLTAA